MEWVREPVPIHFQQIKQAPSMSTFLLSDWHFQPEWAASVMTLGLLLERITPSLLTAS